MGRLHVADGGGGVPCPARFPQPMPNSKRNHVTLHFSLIAACVFNGCKFEQTPARQPAAAHHAALQWATDGRLLCSQPLLSSHASPSWYALQRQAKPTGRLTLALGVQRQGVIQSLHDPLVQRLQPGKGSSA